LIQALATSFMLDADNLEVVHQTNACAIEKIRREHHAPVVLAPARTLR
jgi:hypothetical protein